MRKTNRRYHIVWQLCRHRVSRWLFMISRCMGLICSHFRNILWYCVSALLKYIWDNKYWCYIQKNNGENLTVPPIAIIKDFY